MLCVKACLASSVSAAAMGLLCLQAAAQTPVQLGEASYYDGLPDAVSAPVDVAGVDVLPTVSSGFDQPPTTGQFWSSLIFRRYPESPFGYTMFPNPLAIRAQADGLVIGYDESPVVTATYYAAELSGTSAAMVLGVDGLNAPEIKTAAYSDWTVTGAWEDGVRSMRATFGHGLPYVFVTTEGGDALVTFDADPGDVHVWADRGSTIGVTIEGVPYALFAPTGSGWTIAGVEARASEPAQGYYSVALLPDANAATLDLFEQHAYAFVTGTRVDWSYDAPAGVVDTTFTLETTPMEGAETDTITALYRHQWLNADAFTPVATYTSGRGEMRAMVASSFQTRMPFAGVLPALADTGAVSPSQLSAQINAVLASGLPTLGSDTYGAGKGFGRAAHLLLLADQAGHTAARDELLEYLELELTKWFTLGAVVPGGDGRDAYNGIEAETYDDGSGVSTGAGPGGGQAVTDFGGGDWVLFEGVDFGSATPSGMWLHYASDTGGSGLFQARIDSVGGPIISEGGIAGTGSVDNWVDIPFGAGPGSAQATGVHDVYLTIDTPYPGEIVRLDSFLFNKGGTVNYGDTYFAYDPVWRTLIGYPDSYGLGGEMNDHHFHYGYFVQAAAIVAMFDPSFASPERFGGIVEELIRDSDNWNRADTTYPFLRSFDPYEGHGWASGHQGFHAGNNEESSSESINFATGCILWGMVTGNDEIRDLGVFLHATETAAVEQYWFDVDDAVFPPSFPASCAGIIWSNGVAYGTWWTANPEEIHGINFLPINGGSLYLGRERQGMVDNYAALVSENGGDAAEWANIIWSALALADPTAAKSLADAHAGYNVEAGDTRAHSKHWIDTLAEVGPFDASVWGDHPASAAFGDTGDRRYMAWNPGEDDLTVAFSDGFTMCVAPGELAYRAASEGPTVCDGGCLADLDGNGTLNLDDLDLFVAGFIGSDPIADLDGNGTLNLDDLDAFIAAFLAGCP